MSVHLSWRADGPPDATPLVLLNSVGSTSQMWTPCLGPLAEHFRVIRIDTRGHGDSPAARAGDPHTLGDLAEDVLAALDEVGIGRCHLAGVSLGAMIGMWLAIHVPDRIGRLALLCTAARMGRPQIYAERAAAVRSTGMSAISGPVVERWITPALAERDPALVTRLREMVEGIDAESYAQCCEAIAGMDLRADLGRIAAPTLVVGSAADTATPVEHQQLLAERIAGARLEVIPDAAHVPTFDQPAQVARLLREHFRAGATAEAGYAARRAVLGDGYVDTAIADRTELTAEFQDFLTRYAWGEVWTRPELSRRERSVATLAALETLGAEHELAAHVHGALRNGLTPTEVIEVLQHVAVYAGLPRANRAVAVAREVLGKET